MTPNALRLLLSGLAGGLALNLLMLLTFWLLGFGRQGGGSLLNPALQSPKLIAVWAQLEPLPLVVAQLAPIMAVRLCPGPRLFVPVAGAPLARGNRGPGPAAGRSGLFSLLSLLGIFHPL